VGAQQLNQIDLYNVAGVKQATQATMGYDAAGNLISKTMGNTVQSLGWDANNDLRQVVSQVTNVVNGVSTVTSYNEIYNYDHEGRRIARQMVTGSSLYQSLYLYNGEDIHKEYAVQWVSPVAAYTQGPAQDDPLIYQSGAGSKYYHADGLGSTTLLTDAAGGLQAYRRYDPWGRTIASGGTMPTYGYTGREPDLSTGYMYYRSRYYDPTIGRFLGRDPMGLDAGINVYAYVGDNPTNNTDPSGMYAQSITNTLSGFGSGASSYYDSSAVTQVAGLSPSIGPSPANFFTDTIVGRAIGGMVAPIALFTPNNVNPLTGYVENFNGNKTAEAAIGLMTLGVGAEVRGEGAAIKSLAPKIEEGAFSILEWAGYPAGVPRPTGAVNLINGADYSAARKAADNANRAIHRADPSISPNQIHEIQPVKFGGSPTDPANNST